MLKKRKHIICSSLICAMHTCEHSLKKTFPRYESKVSNKNTLSGVQVLDWDIQ